MAEEKEKKKTLRFEDTVPDWTCGEDDDDDMKEQEVVETEAQTTKGGNEQLLVVPEDIMVRDDELDGNVVAGPVEEEDEAEFPHWLSRAAKAHPWLVGGTAIGGGVVTWYVLGSLTYHGSAVNVIAIAGLLLLLICSVLLLVRSGQLKRLRANA